MEFNQLNVTIFIYFFPNFNLKKFFILSLFVKILWSMFFKSDITSQSLLTRRLWIRINKLTYSTRTCENKFMDRSKLVNGNSNFIPFRWHREELYLSMGSFFPTGRVFACCRAWNTYLWQRWIEQLAKRNRTTAFEACTQWNLE